MKIPQALTGKAAFLWLGGSPRGNIVPAAIDVSRYMGKWRVLACTDNPAEKKFVDASENYTLIGTDRVGVTFRWRSESLDAPVQTHHFNGTILDDPSHGVWRMKLFPFFSATYLVVEVAPEYSWAAVAHPSRKFGWLLAREKQVPEEIWSRVMGRFAALDYDVSSFRRVPQGES